MAKSFGEKESLLESYKDLLESYQGYFTVNPTSISNVKITKLKKELKNLKGNITVVKNSVFKIALRDKEELPTEAIDFDGPTAAVFFKEEPNEVAKLIKEIQKETDQFEAKYGILEKEYIAKDKVMQLADIPSREILLSQLMSTMNGPVKGFMNGVTGNVRDFVTIISKLSDKK